MNLVDDDLDLNDELKRVTSVSFAIPIDIKISDKFSFQPELSFLSKGFKVVVDERKDLDYYSSETLKINFLEFPLLAKANFEQEKIRYSIYAGPSIGFALNGKYKEYINYDGDIDRSSEKLDFDDDDYNRIEIGLTIGGMASYEIGKGRAFVDFRIQQGLTKISDVLRSNMFGFSFGYMIPIEL